MKQQRRRRPIVALALEGTGLLPTNHRTAASKSSFTADTTMRFHGR